jgi:hypothetical protein
MVIITKGYRMKTQKQKVYTYSENTTQTNLWQFKTVIETGDVRYLLKLDDYSELPEYDIALLVDVWNTIYQEYSEIAGGNRADLYLLKVKTLSGMQLDYQRHVSLFRMVKYYHSLDYYNIDKLIGLANEEGFAIKYEDFDKTYEKAYTKLMRRKAAIGIKKKDFEQDDKNKDQSIEPLIADLAKFQGYQFDETKMSVKQFANIYKKYKHGQVQ